ncbi:2-oxoglutarate dehydrogenase E1 component [Aquicella lusitana]|uniref:2-oxoglutarate dehydrogenase E1 component n=1 Tax=Aquicella lusitana TaxID=254246 RepID=A0A370GHA2_9COXI|nr:2-oxoglutarate dehydrogenase E1 component [Aquicella lusitana]RDI42730.1 2-oxoglutarate dehydrogenase E1 component [Aquicella lusitana]VVC73415.1 2-oxoglutarate dehydrogenase E1 component [Aquicella lusitana]
MSTQSKTMQELWQDSYLAAGNESYLEGLYETYLTNPHEVAPEWRHYFDNLLKHMSRSAPDISHSAVRDEFLRLARQRAGVAAAPAIESYQMQQQERVIELIAAFRRLGHLQANIDPLGLYSGVYNPILELGYYDFSDQDLKKTFNVGSFTSLNKATATLNEIYQGLRKVYCGSIGFEYMHINRSDEVEWIRERIERGWASFVPTQEEKLRILDRLVVADGLEKYLGFKYVGQKRFSLEGGDSLIPLLDAIVNRSAQHGLKEIILGMAHRGRLNVLVNVVGKAPNDIFAAFEGKGISTTHSGDVKYHLGASSDVKTKYGPMHIALAFNPSHLEIVSPVVQGSVRARQRRRRDTDQRRVVPIQIHGDAAFAGQGVVMETFNMSQARWFTVGGSIHIVVNNQVGFTISNPKDARSTIYCTDIAKMVEAPILHVNANDPEAVYFAALFAIDYRHTFKRDVVIDLVCYRRHGHNEADEPSATQPIMYKTIKAMEVPYLSYAKKLREEGLIEENAEKKIAEAYRSALDQGKTVVEMAEDKSVYEYAVNWEPFAGTHWDEKTKTAVPLKRLQEIGSKLEKLPEGFTVQTQVKKGLDAQKKMTQGEMPVYWGYAETMAYATLLDEGYPIRLCGQDAARGTFAHRHAILHDQKTGEIYIPLGHISEKQAHINLVDSLLSEEAVMAFEYGYATAEPNFLVIWEAQFGDFANGAQVVIDQFISSGEQKWGRLCGLVLFLPHGYEGQGPEHSSARLERYLQLCAQENMQVCVPSTPAQIFHLLRRQMLRPYRKPLIVMTPKSLLRNPLATSDIRELAEGEFQLVMPEIDKIDAKKVDRVIFCSGKIYYELLEQRREKKLNNVAILRVEQLYPFPEEVCRKVLKPYHHVKDVIWCQEEPQNQGAWITMEPSLTDVLGKDQTLRYVGRASSASPAVGYHSVHEKEQKEIVTQALTK